MALAIDLSGRRALVTGAGQNVGRAIASGMGAAGPEVVVNDLRADRAANVAEEIRRAGGAAISAPFDVTSWTETNRAVAELAPDILVNNAGNSGERPLTGVPPPFLETHPDDWEPFIRVNLYGVLYCTRAAVSPMAERGWGRVVTIISDAARKGSRGLAAYSAAKAGSAALMRTLAAELGSAGITFNSVSLGVIMPPGLSNSSDGERAAAVDRLIKGYPVKRFGEPSDVAGVVALLCSDMASWITGQTYPVDGGYVAAL